MQLSDGAHTQHTRTLMKETPQGSLPSPTCTVIESRQLSVNQEERLPQTPNLLTPCSQTPQLAELREIYISVAYKLPSL